MISAHLRYAIRSLISRRLKKGVPEMSSYGTSCLMHASSRARACTRVRYRTATSAHRRPREDTRSTISLATTSPSCWSEAAANSLTGSPTSPACDTSRISEAPYAVAPSPSSPPGARRRKDGRMALAAATMAALER